MFISSSFMIEDLFSKSFLTVQCIRGNIINTLIFVDTCAIKYSFIDEKFADVVC